MKKLGCFVAVCLLLAGCAVNDGASSKTGVADTVYRPNDSMDHVLWTQPAAKLLLGSPAVQLVRWSQAAFPALLPGGVIDSAPMMRPVEIALPKGAEQ